MRLRAFSVVAVLLTGPAAAYDDGFAATPEIVKTDRVCTPTQVGFFGDTTTVADAYGNRILYRTGLGPWQSAVLGLNDPHSIARLPNGDWLVNDTDNHRMIEFKDFAGGERIYKSEFAGVALRRPHDHIVDPSTGYVYLIDAGRHLFRFKDLNGRVDVWTFTEAQMDYARALSWFDGKLHVINSSRGEVLRIDDYDNHAFTVFKSLRPMGHKLDSGAGALESSGLILNDVEFFDGYYYGTNYFTPSYSQGYPTDPGRLIRWKNWADFERGAWDDLSAQIPPGLVPYYLTRGDDGLYIALFNHESRCKGDRIIQIKPD